MTLKLLESGLFWIISFMSLAASCTIISLKELTEKLTGEIEKAVQPFILQMLVEHWEA